MDSAIWIGTWLIKHYSLHLTHEEPEVCLTPERLLGTRYYTEHFIHSILFNLHKR